MTIKFTGNVPKVDRLVTGFHSFDLALSNKVGDMGLAIPSIISIYGQTGMCKTTLAFTLAGLKTIEGKIALADFEGYDPDYVENILEHLGFNGEVEIIQDEKDERMLERLSTSVIEGADVGILDSVGAISPISEKEGHIEEANMGRRAKLMANFSRRATYAVRMTSHKPLFIFINHVHPIMTLGMGTQTSGGEVQKYLASVRIRLKKKLDETDEGYLVQGKIEKNRWGYNNRMFEIYYVAGVGFHKGMSAVFELIKMGLIKRSKSIKLGDKSMGSIPSMIQSKLDDNDFFSPFYNLLSDIKEISVTDTEADE